MPNGSAPTRVIAYVDGFNLYFGLRSQRLAHLYWLDVAAMISRLLERRELLVATKYFTSRVSGSPEKAKRQNTYLEALQTRPQLSMYFGVYQTHPRNCHSCGTVWEVHSEKMTDVNIAVELMTDAHRNLYDTAVIVSADADLSPAIIAVRALYPDKSIIVMFPPGRGSVRLEQIATAKRRIRPWVLAASQLPDTVTGFDGHPRQRPIEWSLPGPPSDTD